MKYKTSTFSILSLPHQSKHINAKNILFQQVPKLKIHNNRYQYFKVQTTNDIDKWINKTNNQRLGSTEHDCYLPNYAILNKMD